MRALFAAILLTAAALLSPAQAASAAPLQADDVVSCDKAAVADIVVVAIRTGSGFKYACANGLNGGGITQDDVRFIVSDFTATPEKRMWAFGTDEKPSGVWVAVHRVGEPLGQRLKMTRYQP